MSAFVSHARNFEDVMLWRALGHVGRGFYLDLGAGEPETTSVTRAFHERGWRGINVALDPATLRRLAAARPDDINLDVMVCDAGGEAERLPGGGDQPSRPAPARSREAANGGDRERRTTLAGLCAEHVRGPIHFLRIEGAALRALRGADFARWRPWVVLVGTFEAGPGRPGHAGCDAVLRGAGYHFAYLDGPNRFYVADERARALDAAFATPPNLWDDFSVDNAATAAHRRDAAAVRALEDEASRLAAERDGWMQESFEAERRAAYLTRERQDLADRLDERGAWAASLEARLDEQWRQSRESAAGMAALETQLDERGAWAASLEARLDEQWRQSRENAAGMAALETQLDERGAWAASLEARLDEQWRQSRENAAGMAALEDRLRELTQAEAVARAAAERERSAAAAQLEALRTSTSWRLTGPLRVLGRLLGRSH